MSGRFLKTVGISFLTLGAINLHNEVREEFELRREYLLKYDVSLKRDLDVISDADRHASRRKTTPLYSGLVNSIAIAVGAYLITGSQKEKK